MMPVREAFTRHPHAVGESYLQHSGVALSYSGKLFLAAGAALVHAFLPFLFEKTASNAIKAMHADIMRRTAQPHGQPAPKVETLRRAA
jgi:hypothetical protein